MSQNATTTEPSMRITSLKAFLYCEWLFFLEEVEEIRLDDRTVYAERLLYTEQPPLDNEEP